MVRKLKESISKLNVELAVTKNANKNANNANANKCYGETVLGKCPIFKTRRS